MLGFKAQGVNDFRKALNSVDSAWGKQLRATHKAIDDEVRDAARGAASGRHATAIGSGARQNAAVLRIGGGRRGDSLAHFMGARARFGWYSAARYSGSSGRQFRPWVGNQWDPGDRGGEPYQIGRAINSSIADVEARYLDDLEDLARKAFPN